ncbi:hypothetical protein [Hymenobacter cheonanensis]|uniref:hypothetical protein n=1 Tax=Hymenobacter sp. CA2-7 TaxID=3063993 RepID=UPI0027126770|nr:hypothetical protein [Hymenobacter sp. CA2-7]MDO7884259.1 hypothetical protein [Hymenobacter sp. CA2-7]
MAILYLLALFLLCLVCFVLLYTLPLIAILLLVVPLAWLVGKLVQGLTRLLPEKAKNPLLLCSLLLWAGLWVLTYYAPAFAHLPPALQNDAALLCACISYLYPIPLVLLLILIKRNGYAIFIGFLFVVSKLG